MARHSVGLDRLADIAAELTPLPASVVRLNEEMCRDEPRMHEVEEIVKGDPLLAADVVRIANSAWYARQRNASTVRDAIMRLGSSGLIGVAMRMATMGTMATSLPLYRMEAGELFSHSVRASVAAEALRQHAPNRVPAAATVAALLHDVGKLLLTRMVDDRFAELIASAAEQESRSVWRVEQDIFDVDHAQLAAALGRHWRLPLAITDGMVHHHEPRNGRAIAHVVHVANAIAKVSDGIEVTAEEYESALASLQVLDVEPTMFGPLCDRTAELHEMSPLLV